MRGGKKMIGRKGNTGIMMREADTLIEGVVMKCFMAKALPLSILCITVRKLTF